MKSVSLSAEDAHHILRHIDEGFPLPDATRERLEALRQIRLRELDVLENYVRGGKNTELCERWGASQTIIGGIARRLGL